MPAVSAVPADADPLARGPSGNARTDCIDDSRNLMSGNPRILHWPHSLFGQKVAVANAARLYFDTHGSGTGLGDPALDEFKRASRPGDLHGSHRFHITYSNRILKGIPRGRSAPGARPSFHICFQRDAAVNSATILESKFFANSNASSSRFIRPRRSMMGDPGAPAPLRLAPVPQHLINQQ